MLVEGCVIVEFLRNFSSRMSERQCYAINFDHVRLQKLRGQIEEVDPMSAERRS